MGCIGARPERWPLIGLLNADMLSWFCLQFFVGPENPTGDAAKDYSAIKAADYDATSPQGAMTIVLKSGDKGKY